MRACARAAAKLRAEKPARAPEALVGPHVLAPASGREACAGLAKTISKPGTRRDCNIRSPRCFEGSNRLHERATQCDAEGGISWMVGTGWRSSSARSTPSSAPPLLRRDRLRSRRRHRGRLRVWDPFLTARAVVVCAKAGRSGGASAARRSAAMAHAHYCPDATLVSPLSRGQPQGRAAEQDGASLTAAERRKQATPRGPRRRSRGPLECGCPEPGTRPRAATQTAGPADIAAAAGSPVVDAPVLRGAATHGAVGSRRVWPAATRAATQEPPLDRVLELRGCRGAVEAS